MRKTDLGIAVVVIGLAIALLVPTRGSDRGNGGNETAAIATLRYLGSAQSIFRDKRLCDLDSDGVGEFGTLGEMTGRDGLRADSSATRRDPQIATALLTSSLAAFDEGGVVSKSGYRFQIFLPREKGGAVHEGKGAPFSGPVDVDASEKRWCAYAWPLSFGNSGNRTFFIDQDGDVWSTRPSDKPYQGLGPPPWDAAMPVNGGPDWSSASTLLAHVGRDGNEWKPVN